MRSRRRSSLRQKAARADVSEIHSAHLPETPAGPVTVTAVVPTVKAMRRDEISWSATKVGDGLGAGDRKV